MKPAKLFISHPSVIKRFLIKSKTPLLFASRSFFKVPMTDSIAFVPENYTEVPEGTEIATFGAGCYWGTEKYYRSNFNSRFPGSIIDVKVGFMGGKVEDPTYPLVCTGKTNHVEVAQVTFNPKIAPYEELVKFFFSFHDPTTPDRQGEDQGTQYASVIFAHSLEQRDIAQKVKDRVQTLLNNDQIPFNTEKTRFQNKQVVTRIFPSRKFWSGPEDHQLYLFHNPSGYCNHKIRFVWPEWKAAQETQLEKAKQQYGSDQTKM